MGTSQQATMHLTGAGTDMSLVFQVKDVDIKVTSLKFSIHAKQLMKVKDRMEQAKTSKDTTPTQALKNVRSIGCCIVFV